MNMRNPISKISERHKSTLREYKAAVLVWRASPENNLCAVCGKGPAMKWPHHIIPKSVRPDLYCDPLNFLPVDFECHVYIHNHIAESYSKGWLGHSWDDLSDINRRRKSSPRLNEIPLKQWLQDTAAQLHITPTNLRSRIDKRMLAMPPVRRVNARVIYVLQ